VLGSRAGTLEQRQRRQQTVALDRRPVVGLGDVVDAQLHQPRFHTVPFGPSSSTTPLAARSSRIRSACAKSLTLRAAWRAAIAASISASVGPATPDGVQR